ncbi:hypothetical protein [Rhizobium sp. Root483D2]|uniref:hypothetical protein n=1 Tax=Rhizobium sp. Root483D2 TaxID=1736545 RepID=UPI000715CECF|nr:hypothetical protein [Rhizobium sp. Root483D2]KQY20227.1 hypothetical protein ASD32_07110 [Rhizobium sp. Root483D2]
MKDSPINDGALQVDFLQNEIALLNVAVTAIACRLSVLEGALEGKAPISDLWALRTMVGQLASGDVAKL